MSTLDKRDIRKYLVIYPWVHLIEDSKGWIVAYDLFHQKIHVLSIDEAKFVKTYVEGQETRSTGSSDVINKLLSSNLAFLSDEELYNDQIRTGSLIYDSIPSQPLPPIQELDLILNGNCPYTKICPVVNNEIIKDKLKISYKELEQGGSFGRSLKDLKLFPAFMTNLITVGEESGKLTDALAEIADSYERDADEVIRVLTNLLEPLMILFMGVIVGFIVIAMLLPVFEINFMVR